MTLLMIILISQNDEDVTELELLELFGSPVATTNMKELKKKGETDISELVFIDPVHHFRMRIMTSKS